MSPSISTNFGDFYMEDYLSLKEAYHAAIKKGSKEFPFRSYTLRVLDAAELIDLLKPFLTTSSK